jgi:hypothetical protein
VSDLLGYERTQPLLVLGLTWKTRAVLVTGIMALLIGLGLVDLSAWGPTPSRAAFSIGVRS